MHMALAVGSAAMVGFLTGLFSFRVKSRWCPTCGWETNEGAGHGPA